MAKREDTDADDQYRYDSFPEMGNCLIINNKTFTGLSCRDGTDEDETAAENTFKQLGYRVKVEKDQTASQIRRLLITASQKIHTEFASFVCVMLSHGDEGKIYGTDGVHVELKELMGMFRGDLCKSLVGKPKLFFIQACRLTNLDDKKAEERKIPVEADFLYAYSTVPGCLSWTDKKKGSWFMQALCETLNNQGAVLPLMQMLTRVNGKVKQDFEKNAKRNGKMQLPSIVSMLTKELYFHTVTSPTTLMGKMKNAFFTKARRRTAPY